MGQIPPKSWALVGRKHETRVNGRRALAAWSPRTPSNFTATAAAAANTTPAANTKPNVTATSMSNAADTADGVGNGSMGPA